MTRSIWILAVVTILALGCGGDASGPPPPAPPPTVASVVVAPPTASIDIGDSVALTAAIKDQNGGTVSGKTPTWQSSADAVATVSATGVVKGVAQGSATITATVDGKSGTSAVTVTLPPKVVLDGNHAATASSVA